MSQSRINVAFIIAIDGPAASGKGTLAKKIANYYHLSYLDTGLTYRAVAFHMLAQNLDFKDEQSAVTIANDLDFDLINSALLSSHNIGDAASKIAVLPQLRQALTAAQRRWAQSMSGAVLDGRDIATVVFPDATAKLYITADLETRAYRRYLQMRATTNDPALSYQTILQNLKQRDHRDQNRAEGPLKQTQDALLLDTTNLSIKNALEIACNFIDQKAAL